MASSTLDLSQISLFRATHEQTLASRRRTYVQWSRGMSMDVYLQRDERFDECEHAKDSRLTTWVLAPRNDPKTLDFFCSCETYKRDALVYEPSEKVVKEVTAYGIASVFTPEQNRRRGYAQHMMRLLHWVLGNASFQASHSFPATWGAPPSGPADGAFSVLYSDIGPNFYYQAGEGDAQDSGWRVVGPASSVIPVPREHLSVNDAGEWRALDLPQSEALWADDASLMKKDLEDAGRSHSDHAIIAFLPTRGVAATQALRTMDPTTGELPFTKWGVRLEEQGKLSTTWATWGFELKGNPPSLVVTRMRAPDVPSFECLVQQLLRAAAEADVTQVEVWNLASEFRGAVVAVGGRTYERDDHLPSIKFYGGVDAEHVQFVFNEKFCWC